MANRSRLKSTAVMASRKSGPEALDFLPTPPWATRALVEAVLIPHVLNDGGWLGNVWEPCCGAGHMATVLREYAPAVFASDVHDWGFGDRRDLDFTFAAPVDAPFDNVDWIVTNPPFVLAERILDRALSIARAGVALLLRLQWLEGEERFRLIFDTPRRPNLVCPFVERVAMIEGVWDPEASSATAYAWFVWLVDSCPERTVVAHIPPGQEDRLTRLSDMALATPGEAARRKARRKQAERADA